jgi:hypothetical protein
MDNSRKNYLSCKLGEERGIALVTTLIIAVATVAFIAGVYYMTKGGLRVSTAAKLYTSAQEAAFGGIEYGAAVVKKFMDACKSREQVEDDWITGMGLPPDRNSYIYPCSFTLPPFWLKTISPGESMGGQFEVRVTIECTGHVPIPGSESLVFPPTPIGGSGGGKKFYVYYRLESQAKAKDVREPITSYMEAVYRMAL